MKLQSLNDLLIKELQDLYDAENRIIEALPKMAEKASSPELRAGLNQHLEQTRGQVRRLDQIFDQIRDIDREDGKCKGIEGIIKEGEDLLKKDSEPEVRDAGIIASAQKVEHYEIASYGTVRTYAQLIGRQDWARLLEETENEEKETDRKLNQLASHLNIEARAA
jgi:ferritin-like metal-binding protein YciE